jgi:uncharacterized protein YjbK
MSILQENKTNFNKLKNQNKIETKTKCNKIKRIVKHRTNNLKLQ